MEGGKEMRKILITGSEGFVGKNLQVQLRRRGDIEIIPYDKEHTLDYLKEAVDKADFIFHLAGENRPKDPADFMKVNKGLTETLTELAMRTGKKVPIAYTSSIQAELDNEYGKSKKAAEDALIEYSKSTGSPVCIFRFPNLFGKWSRPNYNSVVSTFCYNISHDLEITISNEKRELELTYIDDVVNAFNRLLDIELDPEKHFYPVGKSFKITLGELAKKIYSFKEMRETSILPDLSDEFTKDLYSTYLSYLEKDNFSYEVEMKTDNRGMLCELLKSPHFGQIFVSTTKPGITRGNHYHDTKIEKFCVISGNADIKFRHILNNEIISYKVSGEKIEIIDIPPGYTHSITNIGDTEMITLFWANEMFDAKVPDTYYESVEKQ